jgi:WD40-like Beta Propeller Repeat
VAFLAAFNTIYRDGRPYHEYGNRQVSFPLTLSGNGSVLAWRVDAEDGYQVVVNGTPGTVYQRTGLPVTNFDGSVVAYRATKDGDSWFIVVNGKTVSEPFDGVTDPAVSRDGRVVAYGADGDSFELFVGDRKTRISAQACSVFLSRDGSEWGYVTQTRVVTARGISEAFDEIRDPEFSPDGKRVAFRARRGDRWFVVVDGRKSAAEGIVWGPIWSADGTQIGYGALIGRDVWWKVLTGN